MPFVRISVDSSTTPKQREAVAQAVYEAMRATIGIPEGDKFILVTPRGEAELFVDPDFMGVKRTNKYILVRILLKVGRTPEQKQALYARIAEGVHQAAGVASDDVMVILTENANPDWSFGKGLAQFLTK
jgi:phenylpyruvate tautomerase PptA (4-oxalocrotonate tautomerase family)